MCRRRKPPPWQTRASVICNLRGNLWPQTLALGGYKEQARCDPRESIELGAPTTQRSACSVRMGKKKPRRWPGLRFRRKLHLGITFFSLSIPHTARLSARGLGLCRGQILRKSGTGERYGEPNCNNCCN